MTPKGVPVCVSLEEKTSGDSWAECAVRKDAGDDYDVTNGILVYARAEFVKDKSFCEKAHMPRPENSVSGSVRERSENCLKLNVGKRQETERPVQRNVESREDLIRIDGGIGIGRVTKPGLDQPVGAAAINSVPRKMIQDAVYALLEEAGELFPVSITISIPAGVEGWDLRSRDQRDCGAHERGSACRYDPHPSKCLKGRGQKMGDRSAWKYGRGIFREVSRRTW